MAIEGVKKREPLNTCGNLEIMRHPTIVLMQVIVGGGVGRWSSEASAGVLASAGHYLCATRGIDVTLFHALLELRDRELAQVLLLLDLHHMRQHGTARQPRAMRTRPRKPLRGRQGADHGTAPRPVRTSLPCVAGLE